MPATTEAALNCSVAASNWARKGYSMPSLVGVLHSAAHEVFPPKRSEKKGKDISAEVTGYFCGASYLEKFGVALDAEDTNYKVTWVQEWAHLDRIVAAVEGKKMFCTKAGVVESELKKMKGVAETTIVSHPGRYQRLIFADRASWKSPAPVPSP